MSSSTVELTPRRIAVVTLFALTASQAIIGLGMILYRTYVNRKISHIKKVEALICVFFIVHALYGIDTVIEASKFNYEEMMEKLYVSCVFSALYMLTMMIPISLKLKVMNFKFWHVGAVIFAVPILVLKVISIVHYEDFENMLYYSELNMWGNQLFSSYMAFAVFRYYNFFMDFLSFRIKMDLIEGRDADKIRFQARLFVGAVVLLTIGGFIFSILSFFIVQHAVGVALNSCSTAFVQLLNIWMDGAFALTARSSKASSVDRPPTVTMKRMNTATSVHSSVDDQKEKESSSVVQ